MSKKNEGKTLNNRENIVGSKQKLQYIILIIMGKMKDNHKQRFLIKKRSMLIISKICKSKTKIIKTIDIKYYIIIRK